MEQVRAPRGLTISCRGSATRSTQGRSSWPTEPPPRRCGWSACFADPALEVVRHADAGYDRAIDVAWEKGVKMPGVS